MSSPLRLFPLNAVLFPGAVLNLHVFEPRYRQMIGECLESGEGFGVVLIREGREAGDPSVEPHQIGSVAEIAEVTPLPFGRYYVSAVGRRRFRIREILSREPYLTVDAELLEEEPEANGEIAALNDGVRDLFLEYLQLVSDLSGRQTAVDLPGDPRSNSFAVADALQVADTVKQRLLELNSVHQRLTVELGFLRRLLPHLRKLLEKRAAELQARKERGDVTEQRGDQERYFGKYFSAN